MPSSRRTDNSEESSPRERIFAVGDIHGLSGHLARLLDLLRLNPMTDTVVFTGDYIDRGPDSRGVIELILSFKEAHPRVVCLKGNHEVLLLNYYQNGLDLELFLYNGGRFTMDSYRGALDGRKQNDPGFVLPERHLDFFQNLLPYYETEDYLFVHAGIRPGVPLKEQKIEDLVWIREEFILYPGRFEKTVVFGHTPSRRPYLNDDRIGIDTGAVYGGMLSCLELPARKIYQV